MFTSTARRVSVLGVPSSASRALTAVRRGRHRPRRRRHRSRWPSRRPTPSARLSRREVERRHLHLRHHQRRQQGDRVLRVRRRRPGDGRGREHRPGLTRDLIVELPAGKYQAVCKPGMAGDGIRGPLTVTGEHPRSSTRTPSWPSGHRELQALRASHRAAAAGQKTTEFVDAVKAGDVAKAKALFPVVAHVLGADRAGRGDLRRPRPGDRRPRGRRRAGPASGPATTGSRRSCGSTRTSAKDGADRRQAAWPTSRRSWQKVQGRGAHPAPAGQRRQGTARRGRHRQGHRRGGPLLAHRPVGLPGQRRGFAGRGPGAPAGPRRSGTRRWSPTLDERVRRRRRRCWTSTATGDGFKLYTSSPRPDRRSCRTRSTRWPSRSARSPAVDCAK